MNTSLPFPFVLIILAVLSLLVSLLYLVRKLYFKKISNLSKVDKTEARRKAKVYLAVALVLFVLAGC